MLYPHLIHKSSDNHNGMDIFVVVAHSNLAPEDFSWTGLDEIMGEVYSPVIDMILPENIFRFSNLFDAQRFIAYWWATYLKGQMDLRSRENQDQMLLLTCK